MGLGNTKYRDADDETRKKMEKILFNSCKTKNTKGVAAMLKCGVPPNIRDRNNPRGMTPLMCVPYFCMYVKKSNRRYFLNRKNRVIRQHKIVHMLLRFKADVTQSDAHGKTVLHHFAGGGQLNALELLLETGTDVNVIDPNTGNSPLHYTCMSEESSRNVPILKMLLKYGANPDIENLSNETPLLVCAIGNKIEMAEILLQYSANVNLVNNKRDTPLHCCCGTTASREINRPLYIDYNTDNKWYIELAESLLRYGADVNILNIYGDSVLQLCIKNLRKGPSQWRCFCPYQTSHFNCTRYDKTSLSLLQILMQNKDINPNITGFNSSPLYSCYSCNCTGDVMDQCLFEIGANPNILVYGKPAIHNLCDRYIVPFNGSYNKSTELALKQSITLNIQAGLDLKLLSGIRYGGITMALISLRDKELLEMARLTGYKLFNRENEDLQTKLLNSQNGSFWTEIMDAEKEPLSLQRLVSNLIRICLRPNAIKGVNYLHLPLKLRNFITFNYVSPVIQF